MSAGGTQPPGVSGAPPGGEDKDVPRLGQEATRGMLWSALSSLAARAIGFLTTILLTRWVSRDDYGRANAALTVANTIGHLFPSMTSEVIRRRERFGEALMLRLFWNLFYLVFAVIAVLLFAEALVRLFKAPGSGSYLRVCMGIEALTMFDVASILIIRSLRFGVLGVLDVGGTLVHTATALGLSALGAGGMAILIGYLARIAVMRIIGLFIVGLGWARRPRFDRALLREMLAFSIPVYLADLCEFGATNWDNLFVSAVFGAEALGAYAVAYTITYTPIVTIAQSTGRVVLATISRFSRDKERRREAILRAIGGQTMLLMPCAALILMCGPRAVSILFSRQWSDVLSQLVVSLSLVGFGLPVHHIISNHCQAADFPKSSMLITALKLGFIISALLLFGRSDVVSAGWSVSGAFAATGISACLILSVVESISVLVILRQLLAGVGGAAILAVVILALRRWWPIESNAIALAVEVAAGSLACLAYLLLIHRDRVNDIIEALLRRGSEGR
jgi:O-antigen/teichoic acid export membrane protein